MWPNDFVFIKGIRRVRVSGDERSCPERVYTVRRGGYSQKGWIQSGVYTVRDGYSQGWIQSEGVDTVRRGGYSHRLSEIDRRRVSERTEALSRNVVFNSRAYW